MKTNEEIAIAENEMIYQQAIRCLSRINKHIEKYKDFSKTVDLAIERIKMMADLNEAVGRNGKGFKREMLSPAYADAHKHLEESEWILDLYSGKHYLTSFIEYYEEESKSAVTIEQQAPHRAVHLSLKKLMLKYHVNELNRSLHLYTGDHIARVEYYATRIQ